MTSIRNILVRVVFGLSVGALLVFPGDIFGAPQRDAAERLLFDADQKARDGDVDGAMRGYDMVAQQFPATPQAARALLLLAQSRAAEGQLKGAEAAARALIEGHPRSTQAAGAMVELGEIQLARALSADDLDEARSTFQNTAALFDRSAYPDLEWRSAAIVRAGEVAMRRGAPEEAARDFVDAIDSEPVSAWTARARLGLATVLLFDGDWEAAAEILQQGLHEAAKSAAAETTTLEKIRRRLMLIQRLYLRPEVGKPRWVRARILGGSGQGLKRPEGIAAAEDGRLLLTQGSEPTSRLLGADGALRASWRHPEVRKPSWGLGGERYFVTVDALFVAGSVGRTVFEVAPPDKGDSLQNLAAVEPSSFGRWFVLTSKPRRVLLYSRGSRHRKTLVGGKTSEPVDIATGPGGELFVLDGKQSRILRFDRDGRALATIVSGGWRKPQALTVDVVGNLYVLDRESSRVEIFDPSGRKVGTVGPALPNGVELKRAIDVAIDGSGRLAILDAKLAAVVVLE